MVNIVRMPSSTIAILRRFAADLAPLALAGAAYGFPESFLPFGQIF